MNVKNMWLNLSCTRFFYGETGNRFVTCTNTRPIRGTITTGLRASPYQKRNLQPPRILKSPSCVAKVFVSLSIREAFLERPCVSSTGGQCLEDVKTFGDDSCQKRPLNRLRWTLKFVYGAMMGSYCGLWNSSCEIFQFSVSELIWRNLFLKFGLKRTQKKFFLTIFFGRGIFTGEKIVR